MKTNTIQFLIIAALIVVISAGCNKDDGIISGSGPIVSQEFNMPDITGVQLSIDGNVYLMEGDTQQVRIEAQQNIIDNIKKSVSGGKWNIEYYNNVINHKGIDIYITTPLINYVAISGSGNIESTNTFTDSTDVYLNISGSGNIDMSLLADFIESSISGSGNIYLTGEANEHRITISASGNLKAFGLQTHKTDITISASGNSEVFVTDDLDVTISGSGNVYYKGYPEIDVTISGSGSLVNSN